MSKWRPSESNIYVVGDMHGNYDCLQLILNRILPLRTKDELIFLGDYIDRGPNSAKVIKKLTQINDKYENITCLSGNHEWLMKVSIGLIQAQTSHLSLTPQQIWLANGGISSIVSYAKEVGIPREDAMSMPLHRYKDIVPSDQRRFLKNLFLYYETEKYIFVHAGCNPLLPIEEQSDDVLLWDNSLFRFVKNNPFTNYPWDKTIVCGHNYKGPFVHPKYIMIDVSHDNGKVMCAELNSMTAFTAQPGKKRMVSVDLNDSHFGA